MTLTWLDYSKESSWASLPKIKDEADLIPLGQIGINQLNSKVDVFFVNIYNNVN